MPTLIKNAGQRNGPLRIGWYVHPIRLGGMERFLLRLAGALDPAKVRVVAIFAFADEVSRAFEARGIETLTLERTSFRRSFGQLMATLASHQIDAVQTNSFTPVAAVAAGHLGIPHIWRLGGHPDVALRRFAPAERRSQLELVALQSKAILCNSAFVAAPFESLPCVDPVVIRNGIELPDREADLARPQPLSAEPPTVTMLAHFDEQKRHEDLLRAAPLIRDQVPRVEFRLLGSTFGEPTMVAYRKTLRQLIRDLGLEGRAIMKRSHDVRAELQRASVTVLPSIGESSSNAILESMAASVPVVAAASGGTTEMITSATDGLLVPPRSPERLASAIVNVLRQPALADELVRGAHARLRRDYDLSSCARRYEQFYADQTAPAGGADSGSG